MYNKTTEKGFIRPLRRPRRPSLDAYPELQIIIAHEEAVSIELVVDLEEDEEEEEEAAEGAMEAD